MKQYTEPTLEILAIDTGDIVTASPEDWTTPEQ